MTRAPGYSLQYVRQSGWYDTSSLFPGVPFWIQYHVENKLFEIQFQILNESNHKVGCAFLAAILFEVRMSQYRDIYRERQPYLLLWHDFELSFICFKHFIKFSEFFAFLKSAQMSKIPI